MRNQEQGAANPVTQTEQQLNDALPAVCVQISGRFVGEQDVRIAGEGACQGYTLLFATGQLTWLVRKALSKPDLTQQQLSLRSRTAFASDLQWQSHILQCAHPRQELEGLEHETDAPGAPRSTRIFVQFTEIASEQRNSTLGRLVQPGKQAEQRGFTGTRGSEYRYRLSGIDLHVDRREYVQHPAVRRLYPFTQLCG
mgnify:CR=1 FL=1